MLREFGKDFLRYFPGRVLPGLFGMAILPVMTRMLGAAEYGQYNIILSAVALISIAVADWIVPSVIRLQPEQAARGGRDDVTATALWLGGAATVIAVGGVGLLSAFVPGVLGRAGTSRGLALGLCAATALFALVSGLLVSRRRAGLYSGVTVWQQSGGIAAGLALVALAGTGVTAMLWGALAATMLALGAAAWGGLRSGAGGCYSPTLAREIASYGVPLMATNLAGWILRLADRYVLEGYHGAREVGLYAVSWTIADRSISLVVSLFALSSAPLVVDLWQKQGESAVRDFIRRLTQVYLLVAVPAAVGLALVGRRLVALLTAPEFHAGHLIILPIALAAVLMGIQRNFQLALLLHKRTGTILQILLLTGGFSVVANLLVVPRFGFVGAGMVSAASYLLFTIVMAVVSRRYLIWPFPWTTLRQTLMASAVMGVAVGGAQSVTGAASWPGLILAVLVGCVAYVAALWGFGGIDPAMRRTVSAKLGRFFPAKAEASV